VARDILGTSDIEGSKARQAKVGPRNYNLLDCGDINGKKQHYSSNRDPLNPVYNFRMQNG